MTPPRPRLRRARQETLARSLDLTFSASARLASRLPRADPARHGVIVERDVPYLDSGDPAHTLDIYRPMEQAGLAPAVLYIHGGGFRALSKDTHWIMALLYARSGYVVFNINYRLAPADPFPAAAQDACAAWAWLNRHTTTYGADPDRLTVAGESAGANLAAVIAIASSWVRPEPWARAVFDLPYQPRVVAPACGLLQVSDPHRFSRRRRVPFFAQDIIENCFWGYLGPDGTDAALADPVCVVEQAGPPDRPLPAFFLPVGTADPLLDDTRRMGAAIAARGGVAEVRYYPRMEHAFHAWVFRKQARRCWTDMLRFTDRHLSEGRR